MNSVIESKMKNEKGIAIAGILLLVIAYIISINEMNGASPLALIIITAAGLLLRFKYPLAGNMMLFFGSLAIAVLPFLFQINYWLLPGAALAGYAGFAGLIHWWQNDN